MEENLKQLLLKDLSARLPCGIYVLADVYKIFDGGIIGKVIGVNLESGLVYLEGVLTPFHFDEIKPYLRKMSSMTEEEIRKYKCLNDALDENYEVHIDNAYPAFDWLNARHFDYRDLIEKGLALEALPGMYSK